MGTMEIITQKPFGREFPTTRIGYGIPGGSYCCADGEWLFIAVGYAPALIPKLCQAIEQPELVDDPRFVTAEKRKENREEYYAIFREAFLKKPISHWLEKAKEFDLPLVRMNHFSDVSEDPQAWANGYVEHVDFRSGNRDVMPSSPIEMDSVGVIKTIPAPGIGADTDKVLRQLGYTDEQIQALKACGAAK